MITLTKEAAEAVNKISQEQDSEEELYLRVGVRGGGCSGYQQTLDLVSEMGENDELFEQHGVRLICDPKSHIYLDGSKIDYKSTIMGSGFVFDIPNSTTCGCGQSFSA